MNTHSLRHFSLTLLLATASASSTSQGFASDATVWQQKSRLEQLSFLEGFCEGLKATEAPVGKLTCAEQGEATRGRELFRFCGATNSDGGRKALTFLDSFYKDPEHSDVPLWAAAANFNDRACNERTTEGKLRAIQQQGECFRKTIALIELKVAKAIVDKHREECSRPR